MTSIPQFFLSPTVEKRKSFEKRQLPRQEISNTFLIFWSFSKSMSFLLVPKRYFGDGLGVEGVCVCVCVCEPSQKT